jgi:phage terminase large subunit GpA-like protein
MSVELAIRSTPEALEELDRVVKAARRSILRPPPRMTLPDWADTYRHLSSAAGAVGGPWQTNRVEVARGPMMAMTEPGVKTITIMCSTQTMKTSILENIIGYFAHLDPCPMLLLQPKDESVDAFSKERVTPMIQSTPVLRALMGDKRTRDGDDTLRFKRFPGGFLAMVSAGSPTNLAMRAIRIVLLDEIDKYEPTKEGDPILLAEERMATFTTSALSVRVCSPTWEETSRVYKSYLLGDQRRPYCRCPHCKEELTLNFFDHVHWAKDEDGTHYPDTASIICPHCGTEWSEADRMRIATTKFAIRHYQTKPFVCCDELQDPQVLRQWDWDETLQVGYAKCRHCGSHPLDNSHATFQASKLYSPFTSTKMLASKWIDSKDDPESRQTFFNTQLGIPFKADVAKEVSGHWLATRREQFPAKVPEGVLTLTFGADVQPEGSNHEGRIEVEVVGWGLNEESWSIETKVFEGDPAKPDVWQQFDDYILSGFKHQRGFNMYLQAGCIDSGGHNTQEVYKFARARTGRNVWAIKGSSDKSGSWSPVWPPAAMERKRKQRYRAGYKPVILGVNAAKEAVRQRLLISEPGPGYCHFNVDREEWWFDQLTSERLVLEKVGGITSRKWVLPKGRRNEALDCRVYAYAALQGLYHVRGVRLEKLREVIDAYQASGGKNIPNRNKRRVRGNMAGS